MLLRTPLYNAHLKLGAKMVEFGGWEMPVQYTNVIDEHTATRNAAGLFDICHMGEISVKGKDALKFLQFLITSDLSKLSSGKAMYGAMCLENGGCIDDCFVYMHAAEDFMVVVNASNIRKDFEWMLKHKEKFAVAVKNISDDIAKIDIQGPKAEKIFQKLTSFSLKDLQRFHFATADVDGVKTLFSRTGYTGEDGFELYFPPEYAEKLWFKLLEVGKDDGLKPCGLGARDTLRIEACYSLYGHELTEDITPVEAGIGWAVAAKKESGFIGKEALKKQKEESCERELVAFEMVDKSIPRAEYRLFKDNEDIGFVTSGTFGPTLRKSVGLGLVKKGMVKLGDEFIVQIRDKDYKARAVPRPFYGFIGGKK